MVSTLAYRKREQYSPFTDDFLREPGEALRNRLDKLHGDFLSSAMMAMFIGVIAVYVIRTIPINYQIVAAIIFVLMVAYNIYKALGYFRESVMVRLGLEGEKATGQELTMLLHDGAWVFHDIPYKYGNIDHIVISRGGVFAFETKAVSKPKLEGAGRAEWKMEYDGEKLKFPHWQGKSPLNQARIHAKYLQKTIKNKLDINASVIPVVAIPGWFVTITGKSDVWVINPKNRKHLSEQVTKANLSNTDVRRIVAYIEAVARSVRPVSKKLDPDAADYYDFWNNPRYKPPSVD